MDKSLLLELIKQLREKGQELRTVDAKRELDLEQAGSKNEFVKDVIALANNGEPSYLVIGLIDGSFADVGILTFHHTKNRLNNILENKIDPPIFVDYQEFVIEHNEYSLVEVIGRNPPYQVADNLRASISDKQKTNLNKGDIFIRHQDSTQRATREDLDAIYRGDETRKLLLNESDRTLYLALQKPKFWEYLLTAELLQTRFKALDKEFSNLRKGLIFSRTIILDLAGFMEWVKPKFEDMTRIMHVFMVTINEEFSVAWGPPGVPGDVRKILEAVTHIEGACNELLRWDIEMDSVMPPENCLALHEALKGCGFHVFQQFKAFPIQIQELFSKQDLVGIHEVRVVITAPPQLEEFQVELKKLKLKRGLHTSAISPQQKSKQKLHAPPSSKRNQSLSIFLLLLTLCFVCLCLMMLLR